MTPIHAIRGYMVADQVLGNPDAVRLSALQSGFGTWAPNKGEVGSSIYTGMNFWGDHAAPLKALARMAGQPVYPGSMFFRVTNEDTEGAYVHSDREAGEYTAILYLSKHEDSGTAFYKHRRSGRILMDSFDEMNKNPIEFARLKQEMTLGSEDDWEQIKFIPGIYNRALIFDARVFHARIPKHGFGDSAETGRMVWVCHFET